MSQFDVYRLRSGTLVIDCQSELLEHLNTRLVVPLIPSANSPGRVARLNPPVVIEGQEYVVAAQLATAVLRRELGEVVVSLRDRSFDIIGALDVLTGGV